MLVVLLFKSTFCVSYICYQATTNNSLNGTFLTANECEVQFDEYCKKVQASRQDKIEWQKLYQRCLVELIQVAARFPIHLLTFDSTFQYQLNSTQKDKKED